MNFNLNIYDLKLVIFLLKLFYCKIFFFFSTYFSSYCQVFTVEDDKIGLSVDVKFN